MGRKRSILHELLQSPWWISAILAIAIYVGLGFIIPGFEISNMFLGGIAKAAPALAPIIALGLGFIALFSTLLTLNCRRLLDSQSSIEEIRNLDWREFEQLVGEAYRRKGYTVIERGLNGPDGGVDLELHRGTQKTLVQCKHWKTWKVGVSPIRELLGVKVSEGASDAIFVASGQYTRDALEFGNNNNMKLLDGPALIELIASVRDDSSASKPQFTGTDLVPSLTSIAIIGSVLWIGVPLPGQDGKQQLGTKPVILSPSIQGGIGNNAIDSRKNQVMNAKGQREQLVKRARRMFNSTYSSPAGCEDWETNQKMMECGNNRIRAKRLFLAQHPDFATISEIDLQ
jgi:restriction system protein